MHTGHHFRFFLLLVSILLSVGLFENSVQAQDSTTLRSASETLLNTIRQARANAGTVPVQASLSSVFSGANVRDDSLYGRITGTIRGITYETAPDLLIMATPVDSTVLVRSVGYGKMQPDGTYEIPYLESGEYYVSVSAAGYVHKYYDNVTALKLATPVNVTAGEAGREVSGIDFVMERETPGTGSLAGTVRSEDGQRLGDAAVYAYSLDNPFYQGKTRTNEQGAYEITELKTGRYAVQVEASGFISEYFDDVREIVFATPVEVTEPERTEGIDFELQRGGALSGTVRTSEGQPVAGAFVSAFTAFPPDSSGPNRPDRHYIKAWAVSDERGEYRIEGLPTEEYYVFAQISSVWSFETQWYDHARSMEEATPVHVEAPAEIQNIDFTLNQFNEEGSISGRVTDGSGAPLTEVWIQVESEPGDPGSTIGVWAYAITDPEGRYRIEQLPEGKYFVSAAARSEFEFIQVWYPDALTREAAEPIEVNGAVEGIDFVLPLRAATSAISGVVRDRDGTPLSGAFVEVSPHPTNTGEFPYRGIWASTVTDREGAYRIERLPAGEYQVRASYWQEDFFGEQWYDGADTPENATPITLDENEQRTGIDFALTIRPIYGSIVGVVTDSTTGLPVERAYIELWPILRNWVWSAPFRFWGWHAVTDSRGTYRFDHLPEGQYAFLVYSDGAFEYYENAPTADQARYIDVEGGMETEIDINLQPRVEGTGIISGRVTVDELEFAYDSTSSWKWRDSVVPVSSTPSATLARSMTQTAPEVAVVIAYPAGTSTTWPESDVFYPAVTAPDGTYEITGLPEGEFVVMSMAPGYVGSYYDGVYDPTEATRIKVDADVPVTGIDFELFYMYTFGAEGPARDLFGASVYGRVEDEAGDVVEGATVYLLDENGKAVVFARTGPDGYYQFGGIFPGRYRVQVTRTGFEGTFNGNVKTFDEAKPVELVGGRIEVNFVLNQATRTSTEGADPLPEDFRLLGNYPNPFNPETTIRFQLPQGSPVVLSVYNLLGQEVATLIDGLLPAGYHQVVWDARDKRGAPVASGTYLYRLQAGKFNQASVMTLVR